MENHPSQSPNRNATEPATSFSFSDEFVTFIIGKCEKGKPFKVQKEQACRNVELFRRVFNNPSSAEGQNQSYEMEHTTPDAFRLLVSWLYTGNLEGPHPGSPLLLSNNIPDEVDGISIDWRRVIAKSEYSKECACVRGDIWTLINLWILAEYLILPRLQNLAFDKIFTLDEKFRSNTGIHINFICEETARDSMLRKYVFDKTLTILKPRSIPKTWQFDAFLKDLSQSFKGDWMQALLAFPEEHKGVRPKEEYHVPLSRTSDDLADKTADLEVGNWKERSSEDKR